MSLRAKPYVRQVTLREDAIPDERDYAFDIPAIQRLGVLEFHADVTFFVGENGSGKSTLLEALALALGFGPEGGTKSTRFKTADTVSSLHRHLKLVRSFQAPKDHYFLRAESFYNLATYMDEVGYLKGYGDKSLHKRSHGESFMTLLTTKLKGKGLYLLDEPEAALSPSRQLMALAAIHALVDQDSQFIVATHSPILMAYPRAKIILFSEAGLEEVPYTQTEHYAITRDFLGNYPKRLATLMSDEDEATNE